MGSWKNGHSHRRQAGGAVPERNMIELAWPASRPGVPPEVRARTSPSKSENADSENAGCPRTPLPGTNRRRGANA